MDSSLKDIDICIKVLKDCQNMKCQSSCMPCSSYIDCKIRKDYVKSVYDSMSDGKGGFEF